MKRSKLAKSERRRSDLLPGERRGKTYAKPNLTGLGLLRVMTKFSVGDPTWHRYTGHEIHEYFKQGDLL
jgi:hypothetical protein